MPSVRARVIRGRLVVDEPTDLPEGTEVALTVAGDSEDELVRVDVALDEAEAARLAREASAKRKRQQAAAREVLDWLMEGRAPYTADEIEAIDRELDGK
jgi:hypothetical protein